MNCFSRLLFVIVIGMYAVGCEPPAPKPTPESTLTQVRKVPFMYVPKKHSSDAENRMDTGGYPMANSRSKAKIFKDAIGSDHPKFYDYSVDTLEELIDLLKYNGVGIRIYFGAYHQATSSPAQLGFSMGNTLDKQVILIFVGSSGLNTADVGSYYVISPFDQSIKPLPASFMKDWTDYFYANEDNDINLGTTLEPGNQLYNRVPDNSIPTKYSDTRSIYYRTPDFIEFMETERVYQNTNAPANPNGYTIDSIRVYFAVHPFTGIGPNPWPGDTTRFKGRLFLVFEYARNKEIFYIDDDPKFGQRHLPYFGPVQILGGNNGQLCPPNCPCPPYSCKIE